MQELVGRLTALDPQASETLKVISYFDALVAGDVGVETLVRGAAALSGVPAGIRTRSGEVRVAPGGDRLDAGPREPPWPTIALDEDTTVWVERAGTPHANDAMVLERLVLAVVVTRARRRARPDDTVATALDRTRGAGERLSAVARLLFTPHERVRAVAVSPGSVVPLEASTLMATPSGVVRATIVRPDSPVAEAPAGLGTWVEPGALPESWAAASIAYRIAVADRAVVDAEDLGILMEAIRALESGADALPDVQRLTRLDDRSRVMLRALVEAESVRAAAVAVGVHHSTLQARHDSLARELGYDPRSPVGRARYELAERLRRLS